MFIKVSHRDVSYTVGLLDYTAVDAADYRRATGRTLQSTIGTLGDVDGLDLDSVATLLWLAKRRNGEPQVGWGEVASTVTMAEPVTLEAVDEPDPS